MLSIDNTHRVVLTMAHSIRCNASTINACAWIQPLLRPHRKCTQLAVWRGNNCMKCLAVSEMPLCELSSLWFQSLLFIYANCFCCDTRVRRLRLLHYSVFSLLTKFTRWHRYELIAVLRIQKTHLILSQMGKLLIHLSFNVAITSYF